MKRFAIYARYSSDLQNPASIEDQVRLCSERIERQCGKLTTVFADAAQSGTSTQSRLQYLALIEAIKHRQIDIVICESLDRLSRSLSDISKFFECCQHNGVKLFTLDIGEITLLHVGILGTMNALFVSGLRDKVKRGQRGAFERGGFPGGLAYGYKKGPKAGTREIDDTQGIVILGIFADYLSGISPRKIAKALNAAGVPAFRGGKWRASLIVGSLKRGNGIFHNSLLNGVLVVGRQRRAKDPTTGKTIMQDIPQHEWVTRLEPTMRIVNEADWNAVQAKIATRGGAKLHYRRRPKRLLSGLIKCACCGGLMVGKSAERLVCRIAREEGQCDHTTPINVVEIETRIVAALQGLLADEGWEQVFAAEYRSHRAKIEREGPEHRAALIARQKKAESAIANLLKAIENGLNNPDVIQRLAELGAQRDTASRALATLQQEIAVIYPNMPERFKIMRDEMGKWLSIDDREAAKAKETIRSFTQEVLVYKPTDAKIRRIEFTGQILRAIDGGERGS